ncbi:MAG: PAS domain-containing protein [Richelia sp.]|nr:PAS domain-containing protein [Richelia sp.]
MFFSTRWKQMLGYEEHEITNHVDEWSNRVHPDHIGWVTQLIQDHFDKKNSVLYQRASSSMQRWQLQMDFRSRTGTMG